MKKEVNKYYEASFYVYEASFYGFVEKVFELAYVISFLIGNILWSLYNHLKNFNDIFSCCSSKILTFILETVTEACHLPSTNRKQEILFSVFKFFLY